MFIECRHILPRGTKCKSPALRGKVYCYFHDRLQRFEQDGQRDASEPLLLPSLEDARGIQMAISQILAALGSGRLESRKAGLYLYGLQLATQLLAQLPEPSPQEMVRTVTTGADGNYIAAEETPQETQFAHLIEGHDGSKASSKIGSIKVRAGEKLQLGKPGPNKPDSAKHWFDTRSAEQLLESEAALH
ncbi:MAG TPA: hypothetical protein VHX20_13515 [Terracidiphilus sp.]|jgi:hypothetical protein|nr:hypothetical protein [Terracidiphilus sp.]